MSKHIKSGDHRRVVGTRSRDPPIRNPTPIKFRDNDYLQGICLHIRGGGVFFLEEVHTRHLRNSSSSLQGVGWPCMSKRAPDALTVISHVIGGLWFFAVRAYIWKKIISNAILNLYETQDSIFWGGLLLFIPRVGFKEWGFENFGIVPHFCFS